MTIDSNRLIRKGQPAPFDRARRGRSAGFSMLEMLVVMIVVTVLIAIVIPKMARIMSHERVNRAAQVVVADLQNGFAMAGRQRAPVRLQFWPTLQSYVFSDRATGAVIQTRTMNKQSEYALTTLTGSPSTVDILPNGIGSTAFTVTISQNGYTRVVTASSAGFVRLVPL